MKYLNGILGTIGIIFISFVYLAFLFLTTFREYDGVWYNCMYAKTGNAKIACGVKDE